MSRFEYMIRDHAEYLVERGFTHSGVEPERSGVFGEAAKQEHVNAITEALLEETMWSATRHLIRTGKISRQRK